METTIAYYNFDLDNAEEAMAWAALKRELKTTPGRGHIMNAFGGDNSKVRMHKSNYCDGKRIPPNIEIETEEIELECECLFENQWNTPTRRVFDWWLEYLQDNNNIRRGHYLEITDEMREIRRNTHKCGYCGKMEPAAKGYTFCPHCIDSEYLEESQLRLTRMMPVDTPFETVLPDLADAERDHLLPLYKEAQIHGATARGKERIRKQRCDTKHRRDTAIENATTEHDGIMWLLDNGVNTNNVIFYSHTGRFGFGWRKPIDDELYSSLVDVLCEFPFDYDIKRVTS